MWLKWVWVNTYRYIFSGMNIHLPAILMFTRGTRFWPIPKWLYRLLSGFLNCWIATASSEALTPKALIVHVVIMYIIDIVIIMLSLCPLKYGIHGHLWNLFSGGWGEAHFYRYRPGMAMMQRVVRNMRTHIETRNWYSTNLLYLKTEQENHIKSKSLYTCISI